MFVAKVTGSVVATQKTAAMVGFKLLVVEPYRLEAQKRNSLETEKMPIDTVVIGIIDSVHVDETSVYSREN